MFLIKRRTKNYSERPKVEVDDILKLVGYKIFTRKSVKLKWTHESLPTAFGVMINNRRTFYATLIRDFSKLIEDIAIERSVKRSSISYLKQVT